MIRKLLVLIVFFASLSAYGQGVGFATDTSPSGGASTELALTLDDVIHTAQNQSIAAMTARYTFCRRIGPSAHIRPAVCRRSTSRAR